MSEPRVVMLIERYAPLIGGSETQCRLLVQALQAAGVPVFVITRRVDPKTSAHELLDGVDIYRLWPSGIGRIWKEVGFIFSVTSVLIRFRRRYDIIHMHSGTSITGAWTVMLVKVLGKKTIVKVATAGDIGKNVIETSAAASTRPSLFHRLMNININWALRRADRILCISQEIYSELLAHHFSKERLTILPNAIDTARYQPARANQLALRSQLNLPTDKKIVLYTGRLIHRKGVDVLLKSWHTMPDLWADTRLVLVGGQAASLDAVEQELRQFVEQNGLADSVIFAGETSDTLPYLQSADLFVFPSRREGLSNSLLEALSVGLPTVATAIGGNVDQIQDQVNGLLVPSDDHQALAKAIRRLLTDSAMAHNIGQQARQYMISTFSLNTILPKLQTVYTELTNV